MSTTIAIVSYNTGVFLTRCLASIYANPPSGPFEVVVVDNASSDDSVDQVRAEFPEVRLIPSDRNLGFAGATNCALERAAGDVLVMLNPDTEVRPGALEQLAAFLRTRPEAGAAGPKLAGPTGKSELSCHPFPNLWQTLIGQLGLERLLPGSRLFGARDMTWWDHADPRRVGWVSAACLAVSRAAWEKVGPLDESYFMYSEDVDWCYRLAKAGLECWYLPTVEVVHYEAGSWGSASRERILASHRANFRFFAKHHGRSSLVLMCLLVGLGALLRGGVWTALGPFVGKRGRFITDPGTHFRVANMAVSFGEEKA